MLQKQNILEGLSHIEEKGFETHYQLTQKHPNLKANWLMGKQTVD